jgi:transposase-like protein
MRQELFMARRKRRKFTRDFKAEAVRLARAGDRSVQQVAEDLDLTESALRNWLKQTEVDAGQGSPDALTTAEKAELSGLRREVKRLREERDILKAAATYFAKESK